MGLLSFFSRKDSARPLRRAAMPSSRRAPRARRRLIGAAVLLGLGVIGFPLLFETQPRPIAVDVPIEIPRKDAVRRCLPRRAASRGIGAGTRLRAGHQRRGRALRPDPVPSASASASAVAAKPAPPAEAPRRSAGSEARGKPASTGRRRVGRFVVQVGAYADAGAARAGAADASRSSA